jgi:hypothetical protein
VDTGLGHGCPRFELGGGVIAEGRVTASPIIEHLNVLEDILSRGFPRFVVPVVHELALECPEEAFDTSIVPAVAGAAHAGSDVALVEQLLVGGVWRNGIYRTRMSSNA